MDADREDGIMRIGILSDIHITPPHSGDEWFVKALRRFDAARADAVLIAGDLTTWSRRAEFEAAMDRVVSNRVPSRTNIKSFVITKGLP